MPSWRRKVPPRTGASSKRSTPTRSRSTNSPCEPWPVTDRMRWRPSGRSSIGDLLIVRRSGKDEDCVDRQHDVRKRSRSDATTAADPLDFGIAARRGPAIDLDDLTGKIDDPDLRNSRSTIERKLHRPIVALGRFGRLDQQE